MSNLSMGQARLGSVVETMFDQTEEAETEAIIERLVQRLNAAREGSAEHRTIVRQLIGVREGSELGGLISLRC